VLIFFIAVLLQVPKPICELFQVVTLGYYDGRGPALTGARARFPRDPTGDLNEVQLQPLGAAITSLPSHSDEATAMLT
jgi:hypothetical protein